eukprot:scaffold32432_cov160-Amphora_coffeaeformis.AAC.3
MFPTRFYSVLSTLALWWMAVVVDLVHADLVINEIYRDNAWEWIELCNTHTYDIDIKGYSVQTVRIKLDIDGSGGHTIVPAKQAGDTCGYFTIGRYELPNDASNPWAPFTPDYLVGRRFSIKNHAFDRIWLKNEEGDLMDKVEMVPDVWPYAQHTTLSLNSSVVEGSNPVMDNNNAANWCESPSGGTPNADNDCP